jgi:TfoX/Sxy family transcriptional regulator of competence genes
MAYNEVLANRIRERLADHPDVMEKEMMGGLAFMVNEKMCVGVIKEEMMCRIAPELHPTVIEMTGCRTMDFTKHHMQGWVMVDETGIRNIQELDFYINLALDFNSRAKASKKKKV